ncbi:medium-chain acyl-CoA ligase ACSF2, mitochondrial-like isoform X2 [Littorina saxatilis]|uniref:medium-chain acyl-CoA ligase ACSF2, mitochondrial-like isoform X2 n=1 Tax=Littorina saxatilis TaxID=31220 RepID=UPI0038B6B072
MFCLRNLGCLGQAGSPLPAGMVLRKTRHFGLNVHLRLLSALRPAEPREKRKWSYSHGVSDIPLLGVTIGNLLQDRVEQHPDRDAVVFYQDGQRLSFQQLLNQADQLAAGLLSLGLKQGDRVGMWGPNSREWVLTQYATARAGLVLVNVNPLYRKHELEYALKKVGCKALVAAPRYKELDYYETLFELIPELATDPVGDIKSRTLPDLKMLIMLGQEKFRGAFKFDNILNAAGPSEVKAIFDIQDMVQFDDPINIQFTSGTTGFPKGASLSHHNIVNNSYFVGQRLDYHNRVARICCPVPLYHCFGMVLGCLQVPCHGATMVFPSKAFDAGVALQAVEAEKCTALYGVPTMFIDMLNHETLTKVDLSTLYTGIMAGSPCPIEVMRKVIEKMHMKEVTVCYGSTETSPVTFQSLRDSTVEKRVSTVGLVADHVEGKVVDENGRIVAVGVTGELCTRGYTTMLGYWGDTEKTAECIKQDRWFFTGLNRYVVAS